MIQSMAPVKPTRKLQDQFTTPEQSGMLIEMGVPDGLSADCYYELGKIKVRTDEQLYEDFFHDNGLYIPCWSVGRLIEIDNICSIQKIKDAGFHLLNKDFDNIVESIITSLKMKEEHCWLDFSKLKD